MSLNQSRAEKSESSQFRKSGRSGSSNQQRNFSGGSGKGGGGGTAPPPSPSLSPHRSLKKSNNAQGGQSRVSGASVNSDVNNASVARAVQNGSHSQPLQGALDAPVSGVTLKQTDASTQRSTRGVPKAPSSNAATGSSDTTVPTTPAKAPGDASKSFPLQFGSLSPGLMNGMQIPARTSSAPPNLDEQKRDQARNDSLRSMPALPTPTVPKQQLPRKDAGAADQSTTAEVHPVPKAKRDVQLSAASPATQIQKPSVHPVPGISMQMPFHQHQPHAPVQFAGPNPQMQSQGMANTSLSMPMPMPMPLPMPLPRGNPSQQQVFVAGLQPHPMQSQGIMHQSLNFSSQMGAPLPPQLGNVGINIAPQFQQQQAGQFGGPRKSTVKITDPDGKELRLDKRAETYMDGGSSGPRSHPTLTSQSQPIPLFSSTHPVHYYPNSYNANAPFFPASSHPTSSQLTTSSQGQRFYNQVSQGPPSVSFMNQSSRNSFPVSKTGAQLRGIVEPSNLERARDVHNIISSPISTPVQVTVKPAASSLGEKVSYSSLSVSTPAVDKGDTPKIPRPHGETSSFQPPRDSVILTESSSKQSKSTSIPPLTNSLSTASPAPIKDSVSVVTGGTESTSVNKSDSIHPEKDSEVSSESSSQQLKSIAVPVASKPSASTSVSVESPATNSLSSASPVLTKDSYSVATNVEDTRKETVNRSDYIKDEQKKSGKSGQSLSQNEGGEQSTTVSSLPSPGLEVSSSFNGRTRRTVEAKTTPASSGTSVAVQENTREPLPASGVAVEHVSDSKSDSTVDGRKCEVSEMVGAETHVDTCLENEQPRPDMLGSKERERILLPEETEENEFSSEITPESSLKSSEFVNQTVQNNILEGTTTNNASDSLETSQKKLEEPVDCSREDDKAGKLEASASTAVDALNAETSDASSSGCDRIGGEEVAVTDSDTLDQESSLSDATLRDEGEGAESNNTDLLSSSASGIKDKPLLEPNRAMGTMASTKKKRKELLQKADAAGTTSDLYMAYKGPEEKKEAATSAESTESIISKQVSDDTSQDDVSNEKVGQIKAEPDDWEDAADISTPKLDTSDNRNQVVDGNGVMDTKYSRDFLLKFSDQFTDLPEGFKVTPDIAEAMDVSRESHPSPGRNIDGPTGGSRPDRRGSGMGDEDKWNRLPSPLGYGGNVLGFRPGQGGNYGVLRNTRAQAPVHYAGGILSGPMQSVSPQGGMQRNTSDSDRWQRAKGLIPSPQTPLQVMHKAEKKYEVGKITDEEQAKQRQLKGILNKLTPQNFEKLFEQVKQVNIDNAGTLTGVISQIFDKALMEPTFCEMYANFCYYLAGELPDFNEDNEKITFKRLLLNKCQEEFERGEREQEEANRVEEEGEVKQSEEEREEKRIQARRRMLGNIRLIGELYKKKMLTERIMHECIKKLLGNYQTPDEEDIESLCKLMSTIGVMIDHPKAKEHMDVYFDMMTKLSNNMKLSSRVRFMLKDAIDLRKNKWQQRRKVEGPKKIEEVHRDAAQERQAQASRLSRGPSINSSVRRGQPMDYSPRGSNMLSPNVQMGGFRGLPQQMRGYGTQDIRSDERHSFENRTLSVPLPQRPIGDDSITLGPQGGLARGMSIRGHPSMANSPLADMPGPGDSRRMNAGMNGYSSLSERAAYGQREDLYQSGRFVSPAYDQSSTQARNINNMSRDARNADRSFDRSMPTSPPARSRVPTSAQTAPSEKVWPEERLRDMSIEAIKEFYSANDEKEVARCIKDLNAPSFYPSMISLWITDSFERKDMERDLLAKLLINLAKPRDGMLTQGHLIKGFESVLGTLEDAVNDAPKAAEFLGRIFAKILVENVIPMKDIERLLYEGGEEQGRLVEIGLAAEVLGIVLEMIVSEKGEAVLKEMRSGSSLRLENFRLPGSRKSWRLDKFI